MQAWNVFLNGKLIDTVFFDRNCERDYVQRCLINHDGYDHKISVRRTNKYQESND